MSKDAPALSPTLTRIRRKERGVQLMEVAIVLPVLLVLLAAIAEFGRYFYVYSTLSRATRTAVRHVASNSFKGTANADNAAAINLALCGSTATCTSGSEILSGLTADNFQITTSGGSTYFPTTVTVQVVSYNYTPLFNLGNFVAGVSWTSISVAPSTSMRYLLSN